MSERIYPVLENPVAEIEPAAASGYALAQVVERLPILTPLLDFYSADPLQIAQEIGVSSPLDEHDLEDLREIDFGPGDWYEASAGLIAVQNALDTLRKQPETLSTALYNPRLRTEDVIADLEEIERVLLQALQHEGRFHFLIGE